MASIPYVDEREAAAAAVLEFARGRREAIGLMHRQMAHIPPLVEAFEHYSTMIRSKLPLEHELWGLAILRTIQVNNDLYQWRVCVSMGRKAGIADAKIIELWNWRQSPHFSARQKVAFAIIDEHCLERPAIRSAATAALGTLTEAEIVAVCTVMGWFQLTFAFIQPLRIVEDLPDATSELVAIDAKLFAN